MDGQETFTDAMESLPLLGLNSYVTIKKRADLKRPASTISVRSEEAP
jgi:hypothetical protein